MAALNGKTRQAGFLSVRELRSNLANVQTLIREIRGACQLVRTANAISPAQW
jgi:hypothetical protein